VIIVTIVLACRRSDASMLHVSWGSTGLY